MKPKAILPVLFAFAATACAEPEPETEPDLDEDSATEDFDEEHASYDFVAEIDGQEYILTYEGTHDIQAESDPDVTHAVFIQHGAAQNPVTYFDNAYAALEEAASDRPDLDLEDHTMVLATAKIGQSHVEDHPERYEDGHYPYWPGGWRGGSDSRNDPSVSNFDLLDAMALHIADEFPAVESIVFAGHSAGGQVMSRYSVGSPIHDDLQDRGLDVRYVVSNPSSFLYLDRQRPDLDAEEGVIDYANEDPVVDGEACEAFNSYAYGLEGDVVEYMARRPAEELVADFRDREVFIFQGEEDNDPEGGALDTRCQAMTQGAHRLERGERYYEHLGAVYGPDVYESTFLETVPGVGHSHSRMFASEAGKDILFLDFFE